MFTRKALITTFFLATIGTVMPSAPCQAHSLFIQSGRYQVSSGKGSPLFFCFGHHFPVDDAVRREKLAYVKVIDPQNQVLHVPLRNEKSLHSYVIDYEQEGTYTLVAETTPGFFAMYTDKQGRERHSFKPLNSFIDQAQQVKSSMLSSQWAKAYVVCGKASQAFPAEVGLPLELVPQQDPTMLKQGDKLVLQAYLDGHPYTGAAFWDATYAGFSTEAEDMFIQRTEVKGGRFEIPIDAPGRWFVRFYTKTQAPEAQQKNYLEEKRTATLTFLVRNERRNPPKDAH